MKVNFQSFFTVSAWVFIQIGLFSNTASAFSTSSPDHHRIIRQTNTLSELHQTLFQLGLPNATQVMFAIDYTSSNDWSGIESFGPHLHSIENGMANPYQQSLTVLGNALHKEGSEAAIPLLAFGDLYSMKEGGGMTILSPLNISAAQTYFNLDDVNSSSSSVLIEDSFPAGVEGALSTYLSYTTLLHSVENGFNTPTAYGPIIRHAAHQAKQTRRLHILVILSDGEVNGAYKNNKGEWVSSHEDTLLALKEASAAPLSILAVGMGDGSGNQFRFLKEFEAEVRKTGFENFQHVIFKKYTNTNEGSFNELLFAKDALEILPDHVTNMKKRGLLR